MALRPNGISLLVPTQNTERPVELCLLSFENFADEIIVVDNRSSDNTKEILMELTKKIPKIRFFDRPELKDIYENRQYALEKSRFKWIVRIDSDYVAYNSGPFNIQNLRDLILSTNTNIRPKAFTITQLNLVYSFTQTGQFLEKRILNGGKYVPPPITNLSARIIQYFPGLRFKRVGRWEGLSYYKFLKKIKLIHPFWFHCEIKSDKDFLYRSERTNWRELGNFKKYPTLEFYVKENIKDKYGTTDIDEASSIYIEKSILPYLMRYDEEIFFQYPVLIKQKLKSKQ